MSGTDLAVADREPWEKRQKESGKAFAAFAMFRDLGPRRTIRKVAEDTAETSRPRRNVESVYAQLRDWSTKHDWIERAELYQVMVDRRQLEARMTGLQEAERRQGQGGVVFQQTALQRMRGRGQEGAADYIPPLDIASLSATDVVRMWEVGVKGERMALGQATDLIGKVTSITAVDFDRIVSKIVDLALDNMSEERHDIFIAGLGQIAANR